MPSREANSVRIFSDFPSTYNPHSSCKTLYRSAIVTKDMAHTNASVERIQNAQNVINRNLGLSNLSNSIRKEQTAPTRKKQEPSKQRSTGCNGRSSRGDWWNRLEMSGTREAKPFQRPSQRFLGLAGEE